jgi:3-deoxy-7-phosphoheptulonate synthase
MIIRLKPTATREQKESLLMRLQSLELRYHQTGEAIVLPKFSDTAAFSDLSFADAIETDTPYHLASRKWKDKTVVGVKGLEIGADSFTIMAGPCSVEDEEQVETTAAFLASCGIGFIRGGAFKPRTSPYSFRGRGKEGLEILYSAAKRHGLRVVTEIMDANLLDEVYEHAEILQVGSRNMQNFSLLDRLGKIDKPVLLKRGMYARVTEWLSAAEYVLAGGNEKVILCERGIRSFDSSSRNVMDVGVIPLVKELSHLPVIADPSHGTGAASRVPALALASVAAGADGLLIEIHPDPKNALSDAQQTISFETFSRLLEDVRAIKSALANSRAGARTNGAAVKLESFS